MIEAQCGISKMEFKTQAEAAACIGCCPSVLSRKLSEGGGEADIINVCGICWHVRHIQKQQSNVPDDVLQRLFEMYDSDKYLLSQIGHETGLTKYAVRYQISKRNKDKTKNPQNNRRFF